MSDLIDNANKLTERRLQDEVDAARKHLADSPKATGNCLFCDEPQEEVGRRFCDKECAASAEKYGTKDGKYIPVSDQTRIKRGEMPRYLTL